LRAIAVIGCSSTSAMAFAPQAKLNAE